jgi:lauroyl/myristoyl acyltransferase
MPSDQAVAPVRPETGFTFTRSQSHSAPLFTINDLLWLLYFYPLQFLSKLLPPAWFYRAGKLVEPLVQFRARGPKQRAIRRILALHPGSTPAQASQIARHRISSDMFRLWDDLVLPRPSYPQRVACTGIEEIQYLDQALAAGTGVILLTLHFGANRPALKHLATLGYPTLSLQDQTSRNPRQGRLGRVLRKRYIEFLRSSYPDVVYAQDPECSLKILRRLRSGGLVHMNLDVLNVKTAVDGAFLGVPWRFPVGVFDLIRLSGCAVVPMLCLTGSTGFQIHFDPMLGIVPARSREEFVNANLAPLTEVFERQITAHPEQWSLWTW